MPQHALFPTFSQNLVPRGRPHSPVPLANLSLSPREAKCGHVVARPPENLGLSAP